MKLTALEESIIAANQKPRELPNVGNVTASDTEYGCCNVCNAGLVGQRTYIIVLDIGMYGEAYKICAKCRAGFDAADFALDGDKMYEQAMADEAAQRAEEEQSIEADLRYVEMTPPYNDHWTFPRARE